MGVVFLSMLLPVTLSLAGPIYYGYTNGPYWKVIIWALASTVGFLWLDRSTLRQSLTNDRISNAKSFSLISLIVMAAFLAGDSIAYFLTHLISN
jgi:hypothetical protein